MVLLPAGKALIWHKSDDLFIVYQPSSTETHLFNEISALILASIEQGPRSIDAVLEWAAIRLGVSVDDLDAEEFYSAMIRLDELGLVDCSDDAMVTTG